MSSPIEIDHINIVVKDIDAMTAFYRDVLGMTVTKQVTISGDWIEQVVGLKNVEADVVYLEFPNGPRLELIEYLSPDGDRPDGMGLPNTQGFRHMAFRVKDLYELTKKLEHAGVNCVGEVQQVPDAQVTYDGGVRKHLVYFHDPEGNLLELCSYRKSD